MTPASIPQELSLESVRQTLSAARPSPGALRKLWQRRLPAIGERTLVAGKPPPVAWLQDGEGLAVGFSQQALRAGAFQLASDGAREGLCLYEKNAQLKETLALAQLRLGSVGEARQLLQQVKGQTKSEAHRLSLIGDCFYYEAIQASADDLRRGELRSALNEYQAAAALEPGDFRPLSRAAGVLALLGGHRYAGEHETQAEARQLASRALELFERTPATEQVSAGQLLEKASLLCVLDRLSDAEAGFRVAVGHRGATAHALARARTHARLLAGAKRLEHSHFDGCFPPLRLVVFSGHMSDAPGGALERFPPQLESDAQRAIATQLAALQPCVGFSSAAAGADLLFQEELQRLRAESPLGAESHVVLPWARSSFRESSVDAYGDAWSARFEAVLDGADSERILGEARLPDDAIGFEYANLVMGGLAIDFARTQGLDLVPLVLWNGEPGKPGGTASFVTLWEDLGVPVVNVLDELAQGRFRSRRRPGGEPRHSQPPRGSWPPGASWPPSASSPQLRPRNLRSAPEQTMLGRELKTMLFADVVGYSKLPEAVVPKFVEHFMGLASKVMAESRFPPISLNTWGDALYLVFNSAEAGGTFALDLLRRLERTNWLELGVYWTDENGQARPISLRTALHTGPVFVHHNPIVRALGYTGAHVSRTARIEPITPHASIYVSEEFAALALIEGVTSFRCQFARTTPLAKHYPGEFALYELHEVVAFPVEAVAQAIHQSYCREQAKLGKNVEINPSMRPWRELSADLQQENRNQAVGIKDKLYQLGYELTPRARAGAGTLRFTTEQIELLAELEHERFVQSKQERGWTYGPIRDNERLIHPCLVPWNELSEVEKDKDRDAVRNLPELIALAGFSAVKS